MSNKPSLISMEGARSGGRHEEINPDLIALVARASGSIAVVQARPTVAGRRARSESAIYGGIRPTPYFIEQLAENLPAAAPELQSRELWQPSLHMGSYSRGLNVDVVYQRRQRGGFTPTFRVMLNATTGEALVRSHRDAPAGGPDTDVVDVPGMLAALDLDVQTIQGANKIEHPASPVVPYTLISAH